MKKGTLICWSVSELRTTTEKMEAMGFKDYTPRNNFKSALIKTAKRYVKDDEKMYKRYDDVGDFCKIGIYVQVIKGGVLSLPVEVVIQLNKTHGNIDFLNKPDGFDEASIRAMYAEEKTSLSSEQFRKTVLNFVEGIYGLSVRSGGGIYFINPTMESRLDKIDKLFAEFPGQATLYKFPVYDDAQTMVALEDAASEAMFNDINKIVDEMKRGFERGTITRRQLEGRREDAKQVTEKILMFKDLLQKRTVDVQARLNTVEKALQTVLDKSGEIVEAGEFSSLLASL